MRNPCPACQAPVGLASFFNQVWLTRITCPACKATLRVQGLTGFYVLTLPVAVAVGLAVQPLRLAWGNQALAWLLLGLLGFGSAALALGLSTWMRLSKA